MGYYSFRNQTGVNKTQAGLSLTRDVKGMSNILTSVQIFCNILGNNINTIFSISLAFGSHSNHIYLHPPLIFSLTQNYEFNIHDTNQSHHPLSETDFSAQFPATETIMLVQKFKN